VWHCRWMSHGCWDARNIFCAYGDCRKMSWNYALPLQFCYIGTENLCVNRPPKLPPRPAVVLSREMHGLSCGGRFTTSFSCQCPKAGFGVRNSHDCLPQSPLALNIFRVGLCLGPPPSLPLPPPHGGSMYVLRVRQGVFSPFRGPCP
jgi:hypothetical protein